MATITQSSHSIALGGLTLMSNGKPHLHPEGFTTEVSADGTTWGNPEQVVASLISAIADGDMQSLVRYGNRQPVLHVRISGNLATQLPAGEKALAAVVGQPAELVWANPDPAAPTTVFDVVMSRMDWTYNDRDEMRGHHDHVVTMSALPWGRSDALTVTPAVGTSATTSVSTGASATGWSVNGYTGRVATAVVGPPTTVRSSYNSAVADDTGTFFGTNLRHTVAVDTTTKKYLLVTWKTSLPSIIGVGTNASGNLTEVRRQASATAGYTDSYFEVPAGVNALTWYQFGIIHPANTGTQTLDIDRVDITNQLPFSGTTRQKAATLIPGGSAPTEGSIHVSHASSGLGSVLVYSSKSGLGYQPFLRPWRNSGTETPTADATRISGFRELITTGVDFLIPAATVPPGRYQLWAHLGNSAAGTYPVTYSSRSSMATMGGQFDPDQAGSTLVNWATASTYVTVPIAELVLPTSRMGADGQVRIALNAGGYVGMYFDEAWLFNMDQGSITAVEVGTAKHLWIDAPTVDDPTGGLFIGQDADRSDQIWPPNAIVPMNHTFDPDGSYIVTITSGALDAATELTHYKRWHSNAAS